MTEPQLIAGRYEILEKLGSGRDGSVHLAFDRVRQDNVAIKWMALDVERQVDALKREYELGTQLAHPSWTRVLDHGRDGAIGFFTMEHLRGTPVDRAALGSRQLLRVLFQACEALDSLHDLGFAHADLKPDHLLVTGDAAQPRLKLLDLSLAIASTSAPPASSEPRLVRGTLSFASPAVVAGQTPGPRDDLFALGASFRAGLAGVDVAGQPEGAPATVLDEILARLTSSDPDTRFQSARHVLRDLTRTWPVGAGPAPIEIGNRPLVGRSRELESFERAADSFAARPGPTWTELRGEPGMGKSRLLTEFERRARLRELSVVSIDAPTAEAWARALRELEIVHARHLPDAASALREARETTPDLDMPAGCASVLRAAAQASPLVLFLRGDIETSPTARALVDELLAQACPEPGVPAPPLWLLFASSGPASPRAAGWKAHGVELEALEQPDAALLCQRYLAPDSEALEACLHEHCHGHPGFTEAAARAVARATAHAQRSPEAIDRIIHEQLPEGVAGPLRRRVEALPETTRAFLSAACVFREHFPGTVLARYAQGESPHWQAHLAQLVDAGILEHATSADGPLRFRSESCRRLLAAAVEAPRWQAQHRRAASAWEAEPSSASRACSIATHTIEGGDHEQALVSSVEAADFLLGCDEAALAVGPLLHCVEAVTEGHPGLGPVWERLAETQFRLGQLELANQSFERAAELWPAGTDAFRLWARWGEVLDGVGEPERAREKLLQALGSPSSDRADAYARVCEILGRLEYRLGDADLARDRFERGLEALSQAGQASSRTAASLWNDLGVVAYRASQFDAAEERHRHALVIREAIGDEDGIARSLTNLGSIDLSRGHYRSALRRYEASLAIKRRLGNQQLIALTLSNLALLDCWLGDHRSSIERHEEALRIREKIGAASDQVRSLTHLSNVFHEKSEFVRAYQHASQAIEMADRAGERDEGFVRAQSAMAEILCSIGWNARALQAIDEGLAASDQLGYDLGRGLLRNLRAQALAQTVVQAGAPSTAPKVARELETSLEILRGVGEPRILAAALLRSSTLLSDTPGLEPRADWIDEAAEIAARLETPVLLTRAELLRAHVELASNRPNEASSRLFRVVDHARSLGTPDLLWRAYAGLALFHTHYGRPDRVVLWLQRCIEVLRQVVDRMPDASMQAAYLDVVARRRVLESVSEWTAAARAQ